MFCQNCGKEVPENIKFCNYCGAEQGVDSSPASFQEASQQQSYDCYEPQQQTVIAAKIRNALKLGGFGLVALSVISIIVCLMWHQYEHFINYVSAGDITFLLVQSCMVVGGLLMICMPKSKAALQIGGIVLVALSVLSVLAGLRYVQLFNNLQKSYSYGRNYSYRVARASSDPGLYGCYGNIVDLYIERKRKVKSCGFFHGKNMQALNLQHLSAL